MSVDGCRSTSSTREREPGAGAVVGRDRELAAVRAALGARGAVVVSGAAGVGKSRLAREAVARSDAPSGIAVVTASRSAAEVPLGALAPLLPRDPAPDPPDVSAVREALEAILSHGVVLVDDAHRLDAVSAAALHQAAVHGGTALVLTVRTGETTPDAVTALWKDERAVRIELSPLDAAATVALAEDQLGGPIDATARRRLYSVTGGNPLWLRHLVDGERAAGRLTRVDEVWRWIGRPELSAALEDLLAERIGELTESERHVLELLALGEPLGLGLLETLADPEAVERIAQRELITVDADGTRAEARLAHPLYGEAVRARMSPPRQRRLRGRLVDALAATGRRRAGDQLRQAVLGIESDHAVDPGLLCTAAAQAARLGDTDLAERLFRAARDAGGGFEAQVGLGHLLTYTMRGVEADVELARAVAEARSARERARAVGSRAQNMHFVLARPADAAAMADAAIEADAPEGGSDLLSLRTLLHAAGGDFPAAAALLDRVLSAPDASSTALTHAGWAQVAMRALGGRGAPLQQAADAARTAAARSPETVAFGPNIAFLEALGLGLEGRTTAARAVVDRMRSGDGDTATVFVALLDGRVALDTGRARTAGALLSGLRPHFPGHGGGWTQWIELMVAAAAAMSGDLPAAEEAQQRARDTEHPGMAVLAPQFLWAAAWVSASTGAATDALAQLARAADQAASSGQHALEVLVRHTAVCFGDRAQATPSAALARSLESPRARAAAAHAAAWSARDPVGLDAASSTLEDLELLLFAADAAAQAAVLHSAAGDPVRSAASSQRAHALAERCERPRTPALTAASSPVAVSGREREVATLAARGMSNREIADHMHVSLRTVESHIYRACSRLGLSSRAAFVAAVVPGDVP